jgi:cyclic beta-1,2-glucan synthetase
VLGFRLRGDRLTVEPVLPADWPGFDLTYRHGSTVYEIKVIRHEDESTTLELDGEAAGFIPVEDTGRTHRVIVRVPQPLAPSAGMAPGELLAPVAARESLQTL